MVINKYKISVNFIISSYMKSNVTTYAFTVKGTKVNDT